MILVPGIVLEIYWTIIHWIIDKDLLQVIWQFFCNLEGYGASLSSSQELDGMEGVL